MTRLPRDHVEQLFHPRWAPLPATVTPTLDRDDGNAARYYFFLERTSAPKAETVVDLQNDFGSYSSLGFVVRMLETTKGMGGRWGRVLWGQRPGD